MEYVSANFLHIDRLVLCELVIVFYIGSLSTSYSLLFVLALFTPDGQMGQLLIDINESRRDFRARIAILRGVIA